MLLAPLAQRNFCALFFAQLISLLGTGLATIALALMVYEQYPDAAGLVLGLVLAVKMVAYLVIAPLVGAYVHRLPRRAWLIAVTAARAMLIACLPLANNLWQLFVLMFLLNAFAAGFTPVYQALLPDIFRDDQRYTQALSLSRLAMDIENLLSPAAAAALLLVIPYPWLFNINALAFVFAVGALLLARLPGAGLKERDGNVWAHVFFGVSSYLKTPRLQAALLMNLAISAAGAMIIVNTVIYVRAHLGLAEAYMPLLMAAAGLGSIAAALLMPRLLNNFTNRTVMLAGGVLSALALLVSVMLPEYYWALPVWFVVGFASAMVLIPTGRVVRDSSSEGDRTDYFSANFALTHGMWLICYVAAGALGELVGLAMTFLSMGVVALLATLAASACWRQPDQSQLWHEHKAMAHTHPHFHNEHHQHEHEGWEGPEPHLHPHYHNAQSHRHSFFIDEHHVCWPKQ